MIESECFKIHIMSKMSSPPIFMSLTNDMPIELLKVEWWRPLHKEQSRQPIQENLPCLEIHLFGIAHDGVIN